MKKIALVFVVAVLVPSLALAWLAVRSLRDQQFLLERQQSLLYQRVTDSLVADVAARLAQMQQEFGAQVEAMVADREASVVAAQFDEQLRQHWPLAEVGFCVTLSGKILSPSPNARDEAKSFFTDNSAFLCNRVPAEVYNNATFQSQQMANAESIVPNQKMGSPLNKSSRADSSANLKSSIGTAQEKDGSFQTQNYSKQSRKVSPQNVVSEMSKDVAARDEGNFSKVIPAEAEFAQIVGENSDGMLARFLQNKLRLMFWHRLERERSLIFGAQLHLERLVADLRPLVQADPGLADEICLALLDDNAKPLAVSRPAFQTNWKRPFAATEIGEALPHWEIAAYLVNPARLAVAARTTRLTVGLLIAVLLLTIGLGSWLIVRSLNAELKLARQQTDFVSNVSHELKTPLTSIRMFSELLAEGRVVESAKQKSYLQIISAEASRLTRLINNVLDFSRLESGEKKYQFQPCDLTDVARAATETFRPHLEANGFKLYCIWPETKIFVRADVDALSQIIVNLLSNAEKYSSEPKEISVQVAQKQTPLPHAEIKVMDRGLGVPRGSGEKIFEKFYRAHDSLSSRIQGSGLGLTIARQIARAHGGELVYEPRADGGSCFSLRIPISAG
ncbi:MAG: HAMP domain-containing sensor histidine kinase [Verrucomicrobiota bacterium]